MRLNTAALSLSALLSIAYTQEALDCFQVAKNLHGNANEGTSTNDIDVI